MMRGVSWRGGGVGRERRGWWSRRGWRSLVAVTAMASGLSPLPAGISQYNVAAGGTKAALEEVRVKVLESVSAALEAKVKLCEVEFPPLLGQLNDFADVDNVQILDANRDWAIETAAELAGSMGDTLWLAFPDRKELEIARAEWPGQRFQAATLTTVEDAAAAISGAEKVAQPWGAAFSRALEGATNQNFLGAKPDTASAPSPKLVLAVQPGDGGPLEDWLNLEFCEDVQRDDCALVVQNGAFDKLRGGYYPPILFPKLAQCVDRFITRFETVYYLKSVSDKGRSGWLFRVYPENWQVIAQDRSGDTTLLLESPTRPSYQDAVNALLRWDGSTGCPTDDVSSSSTTAVSPPS